MASDRVELEQAAASIVRKAPAPQEHVRVVFEYPYSIPLFVCIVCDDIMPWDNVRNMWSCTGCGFDLSNDLAYEVGEQLSLGSKRLLVHINKRTGAGGFKRWLLRKILGQQKFLPR